MRRQPSNSAALGTVPQAVPTGLSTGLVDDHMMRNRLDINCLLINIFRGIQGPRWTDHLDLKGVRTPDSTSRLPRSRARGPGGLSSAGAGRSWGGPASRTRPHGAAG